MAYLYNMSSVVSEATYGLTVYTTNTETVTWAPAANAAPVNSTPTLQNPTDTDNLYARYTFYIITTNSSDTNGGDDIDIVLLMLYNNAQDTNYWTVMFNNTDTGGTFSIVNGSDYIALAAYSSNVTSGNWVNITWVIKIDWDHPDLTDLAMKMFTNDTSAESDLDFYAVDWDSETRLDYTVEPNVDDNVGTIDRGDLDGSYYTSGTVSH